MNFRCFSPWGMLTRKGCLEPILWNILWKFAYCAVDVRLLPIRYRLQKIQINMRPIGSDKQQLYLNFLYFFLLLMWNFEIEMTEDRARLYSCHKHRQLYRCTCITYSIFENITIKKNVQRLIFSICHKIYIWTELVDFLQLRHVQLWQLRNTPKLYLHRNKKKLCKKQFYVKFESPSR